MGKISAEEKLAFTRKLREQRIKDENKSKEMQDSMAKFMSRLKEKGVITKFSMSEKNNSVSVNVPTHQETEALEQAWRSRFAQGGKREGAGRKKIGNVRKTWTIPDDILEIVEKKGTAYVWDAVRFKVKVDNMKGE